VKRVEFAERVSAGLAGWLQQLAAQNLEHQVGEDAARVELVRMISAQRAYVPETSLRPTNWPETTKKRIDVAVLGRQKLEAGGWYGAIELKWPNESVDLKAARQAIVEDAVRVAFSTTANLYANFLIVGGTAASLTKLFDTAHTNRTRERQRVRFSELFSRDQENPKGSLTNALLNEHFPDFGDRVPQTVFNGWTRRLEANLIAMSEAKVGLEEKGHVYVWQIRK
jgi:hypothetical protein